MTRSHAQRNVVNTTTVVTRPATARTRITPANVVVSQTNSRARRRSRRTRSSPTSLHTALHPYAAAYMRNLADPFRYPPVKLGFGCLTPSQTVTLTARTTYVSASDGSFQAYVIPAINGNAAQMGGGLYVSTTTTAVALSSIRIPWQNTAAVTALFEEVRIISCGLRIIPMIPGTSAPGAAFVASIPSTNYGTMDATAKQTSTLNPLYAFGYAAPGATVTSRPIDPNSFTFHHNLVAELGQWDDATVTVPSIIMTGLVPGMTVIVESIMHVEGIFGLSMQAQATATLVSGNTDNRGLATVYNSVDQMWNSVSRLLPPPSTVQTAVSLANALLNPAQYSGTTTGTGRPSMSGTIAGVLMP